MKTLKIRLYPTKEQEILFKKHIGAERLIMLVEYELLRDLKVLQGKYEELMKENEMLMIENERLKKENKELEDEVYYLRTMDKCYK